MENDIQITKPTFADKEDQILQLTQYFDCLQHSKSLPEGHEEKVIDEEFEIEYNKLEDKTLATIQNDVLQTLWDIYEKNVDVIDEDIDIELNG